MPENLMISPVAIDLGAKSTGVYFAHYPANSRLEEIEKDGKVYQLEKDSYTLLMAHRTARRHQRRGFDRRQMVKRLFKLIWEKHFGLKWDKDVQQTIGFLMNRRGFSFLTEEYDAEVLREFPQEVFGQLPKSIRQVFEDETLNSYDFGNLLSEWAQEKAKVREQFRAITQEPQRIRQRLVVISRANKLKEYCEKRKKDGEEIKEDSNARVRLAQLPKWILDKWKGEGIKGLDAIQSERNVVDIVDCLNKKPTDVKTILDSIPNYDSEEKELKESVWSFDENRFDLEKAKFEKPDELVENGNGEERKKYKKESRDWIKAHLHHFAFALGKILSELESGGRHRGKYFEEIKQVLNHGEHTHGYLKAFCGKLQTGSYSCLTVETLTNLIGHLSNLELKPLRKYFNDEKHRNGDYWDAGRLKKIFERWILREWRINPEKDKDKATDKAGDYKSLCKKWANHTGSVVDFWLASDPFTTIPPYQDNNNRRPPRCQSLILNPTFLDNKYDQWQVWLGELKKLPIVQEYLGDFEDQLKSLKSGKDQSYFSDNSAGKPKKDSGRRTHKNLKARILQFIFDRVKADDLLNLNEIYSYAKKYRQQPSTGQEREAARSKLEKAINCSKLPDTLKTPRDYQNSAVFEQGSFLHLVCRYYKIRQKARDGRVFIHPEYRYVDGRGYEDTGRFDDKNHLLTYCNHKPRQKRYQMLGDLAGLLQVEPKKLENFVEEQDGQTIDEKLFNWLNGIDTLKANCDRAAKEQKDRRGCMKLDIQKIFGLIYHRRENKSLSAGEIKEILKNSRVNDAPKLHSFCERAKGLCLTVTQSLYDSSKQRYWKQELNGNPAAAVYLLAQINNIAFKERSGNAKTCAVCSTDNAQRMQMAGSANGKESNAKAQRLPAIETRLIDGAVMRMARIVGGTIAKDKWEKIKDDLKAGKDVCVPIITESNRFEFEPSLREIKGKTPKDTEKKNRSEGQKSLSVSKDERIKEASLDICPYTGKALGEGGDKDHIIPRSSEWGTLNDEANLIWASDEGNKQVKKDTVFSLANLKSNYKQKQFNTSNDQEIERWIVEQIGDGEGENFEFGSYRSFINLTPEQQKAFRHALFLVEHPLREKVINAIDNRSRTLVNGTQRYFAEVLANSLYKEAKAVGKQHLLSFDYFGVEAQSNTRGDGVYDLRKAYEKADPEIEKYRKDQGVKQEAYSHLIDAQLAFALIADTHKNDGSLKLKIPASIRLWPAAMNPGEVLEKTILGALLVKPQNLDRPKKLERRKAYTVETHHRAIIAKNKKPSINYQIHRDSIFKENFFPLLKFKDGTIKKGFNQSNCMDFNDKKFSLLLENDFLRRTSVNDLYEVWNILKKSCQQFLIKIGAAGASQQEIKIAKVIDKLTYQTIKKPLEKVLDPSSQKNKPPKTVGEALERWDESIRKEDFKKDGILLPAYYEWLRLHQILLEEDNEKGFYDFVKKCPLFRNSQSANTHNKARKVFSLPVKAGIGSIRLERKSWNKTSTIQLVAEESLAKYGYDGKDRPHTILGKHSIPRNHYTGIPDNLNLEPLEWKPVPVEEIKVSVGEVKPGGIEIKSAAIINKDADRGMVRLTLSLIENLSLPQDRPHWEGKVFCYENAEKLKEGQEKDKNNKNHHCLSSQWKWFENLALPQDRREVEIETNHDGSKVITFTINKSRKVESWLLG